MQSGVRVRFSEMVMQGNDLFHSYCSPAAAAAAAAAAAMAPRLVPPMTKRPRLVLAPGSSPAPKTSPAEPQNKSIQLSSKQTVSLDQLKTYSKNSNHKFAALALPSCSGKKFGHREFTVRVYLSLFGALCYVILGRLESRVCSTERREPRLDVEIDKFEA